MKKYVLTLFSLMLILPFFAFAADKHEDPHVYGKYEKFDRMDNYKKYEHDKEKYPVSLDDKDKEKKYKHDEGKYPASWDDKEEYERVPGSEFENHENPYYQWDLGTGM
ncbi:MAG: hypothetical protein KAQ98_06605 [Bacteriovoracaceae bacterium]|nr:hypothetical protein [Bacteriovoracaceae bacterium]